MTYVRVTEPKKRASVYNHAKFRKLCHLMYEYDIRVKMVLEDGDFDKIADCYMYYPKFDDLKIELDVNTLELENLMYNGHYCLLNYREHVFTNSQMSYLFSNYEFEDAMKILEESKKEL